MTERKFTPPTEFPATYKTDHGCDVTIFGRVEGADQSLVGAVHSAGGGTEITAAAWMESGAFSLRGPSCLNLHDLPKTKTVWVNVYPEDLVDFAYSSLDEASENANHDGRIACVKVTYAEGEGL